MNFSKSKYCALWQCPKIAWLDKYKPSEREEDESAEQRFATGRSVGELAKGLLGAYEDATVELPDGSLDLGAMIKRTAALIERGATNICEAAFSYGGLYCAVDILHRENDGYAIYEVKSSTHVKGVYLADLAYQKYVLQKCGIRVVGTYIVNINNMYEYDGALDVRKLFCINDVAETVADEYAAVEKNLAAGEKLLACADEPRVDISQSCFSPYACAFWGYCTRGLPQPSVFDLYRASLAKKLELYRGGAVSFADIIASGVKLNDIQRTQIMHATEALPPHIDVAGIRGFLKTLSYPMYFLDFETVQLAVPEYAGTKPYAQVPFQYSLHYAEKRGGEVMHREFLGEPETDPRRALAESLCADIPTGVCVVAYNKEFECARIKELADIFPDLAEHLLDIRDNIVDLIVPFRKGYYYTRAMGGSFSVKSVLPALFPDDPALDYRSLDGVHNGTEAMTVFPQMKFMAADERARSRESLLKYCELDTLALVKVLRELERVCEAAE